MSVPSHRKSSSRVRRGRSHDALKAKNLKACPACKTPVMPHRACTKCGVYGTRTVK